MSLPELDLVFCVDCTGSMSSSIKAAQYNIIKIVEEITRSEKRDVRFALVAYRDHDYQGTKEEYTTRLSPFTESLRKMKEYVDSMKAGGGNDGPESVACALQQVLSLDYRKESTKICILIADAPPHGLEPSGDSFPNGCPCGFDPIETVKKMAEVGITIYSVGCEPALGNFTYARDFMKAVAELTGGKHCGLSGSDLLSKVIIAGAEEEIVLNKLMDDVVKEATAAGGDAATDDKVAEKIAEKLKDKGVKTKQLEVESMVDSTGYAKWESIAHASNLKSVKSELTSFAPQKQVMNASAYKPKAAAPVPLSAPSTAFTSASPMPASSGVPLAPSAAMTSSSMSAPPPLPPVQSVEMVTDYISKDQVQRMAHKAKSQKKY